MNQRQSAKILPLDAQRPHSAHPSASRGNQPQPPRSALGGDLGGSGGEWDTTDGLNYSPDEFYTRSSDEKGHDRTLSVRVPPSLHATIFELVQGERYPSYRTVSDVIRDALVHRLHYLLHGLGDEAINEEDIARQIRAGKIARIKTRREEDKAFVESATAVLNGLAEDGDMAAFREYVGIVMDHTVTMGPADTERLHGIVQRAEVTARMNARAFTEDY